MVTVVEVVVVVVVVVVVMMVVVVVIVEWCAVYRDMDSINFSWLAIFQTKLILATLLLCKQAGPPPRPPRSSMLSQRLTVAPPRPHRAAKLP